MNSASGINPEMEGGNRTTTKIYSHFYICKLCLASLVRKRPQAWQAQRGK